MGKIFVWIAIVKKMYPKIFISSFFKIIRYRKPIKKIMSGFNENNKNLNAGLKINRID